VERIDFNDDTSLEESERYLATYPDLLLKQLGMTMVNALIDTPSVSVFDEAIGTRFARQAAATPNHPAIITQDGVVTFQELELMARRIAYALGQFKTTSEEPVAVIVRESVLLYAVMLAVAKLGRIFVPLDPTSPEAWLSEIIMNAGARYVLTERATHSIGLQIAGENAIVLESERLLSDGAVQAPADFAVLPDAVLCVLYTSGSTGRPKGVAISHRTMVHRADLRRKHCGIRTTDRLAHLRSSNFAGGMHDLFCSLLSGATLYPYDVKKRGLQELSSWLVASSITGLSLSSSVLRAWARTTPENFRLPELRLIVAASESLYGADVMRLARHLKEDWVVVHQLSSTETGTIADSAYGPSSEMDEAILPVGRPVEDFEIRLESENGDLVRPGTSGEIVVCSRYLADGYWKDDVLTNERFGSDPDDPSMRLYRTGDLGRWRSDGLLEFLGRKDRKIKLRGYSIELYEVEQALLRLPELRDAVVVVEDMGSDNKRLVAYVASDNHASIEPRMLRSRLFSAVPGYMVPSEIVVLQSLPLTARGKVDRKALPSTEEARRGKQTVSRGPVNEVERKLAQIWREALKRPEIGVEDDFFIMGGDSLQATEVILEVDKVFGVVLPAEVMFGKASTVAGMAHEIEKSRLSGKIARGAEKLEGAADTDPIDVDFAEFHPPRSTKDKPSAFHIDPRTRFRRAIPDQKYGRVVFNIQGYRNPELRTPKPVGTTRIAFLGGSTTLDTCVSGNDAAWPHVACEHLRIAFPGADIDYLNGGLPGFNTRALIVLFKEYVASFEPDAVVIFANDRNSDSNYIARKKGLHHGAHFQPSWLAKHSRKWHSVEKNLTIFARLFRAQFVNRRLNVSDAELTSDFEGRLEQLVQLCQERCPVVVLLATAGRLRRSQSSIERLRSAVTNVFFMPYMSIDELLDSSDAFDEAIRRVGNRTGTLVIDPKTAIPGDSVHYVDSSHFRDVGSKRIAAFVANALTNYPRFRALVT